MQKQVPRSTTLRIVVFVRAFCRRLAAASLRVLRHGEGDCELSGTVAFGLPLNDSDHVISRIVPLEEIHATLGSIHFARRRRVLSWTGLGR
jgi:hypothetical protein